MKAKNESEFTTLRLKKATMYTIMEMNIKDRQKENRPVKLHETIDSIIQKCLSV